MSLLLVGIAIYFLKTDKGHLTLGVLIEDYLSTHTYNKIKVLSFNLENYPYIVLELQLNETANIILKGELSSYHIDMNYHLRGEELHFNDFHLKERIDVNGTLFGAFSSLKITGEGEVFEGDVKYSLTSVPHSIKEMNIEMRRVNIKKMSIFLEEKSVLNGLANIDAHFGFFSKYAKEGQAEIYMQSASFSHIKENLPFILNATIDFQGVEYLYRADMDADIGRIVFRNGYYHDGKQIATGEYKLYLKDIADVKKLLNHSYQGAFETSGTVTYDTRSKLMEVRGKTGQFGGELSYLYKDEYLDMRLKKVSLKRILEQLSYPLLFVSKIDGRIQFNIKDKRVFINTDLKDTHFVRSKLTDIIYEKTSIDILTEVYDKSSFAGGYQNSILSSTLKIDNGKNHIYLTDTTLNVANSELSSKFEIKIEGEELLGKIYGTIDEVKVWIDKERFIEYQADKYLSDWFRTAR
jgi:hypothetical protein